MENVKMCTILNKLPLSNILKEEFVDNISYILLIKNRIILDN